MTKKIPYKHQGNRALYDAMMELRRSGATQLHQDKRQKRKRTRLDSKRASIKDNQQSI